MTIGMAEAEEEKAIKFARAEGKPRMSLVPPNALMQTAAVMGPYGEKKYSAWNYLKGEGLPYSDYLDAALRHLNKFNAGEDDDPESGHAHLAHASCCVLMLMEMIHHHPHQDDRFKPPEK